MNPTEQIIITSKGKLIFWQVLDFDAQLKGGKSKRSIEKDVIQQKLITNDLNPEIAYDQLGSPTLVHHPELFISISHSKDWMALYLAKEPVGVDIEHERTKLIAGSHYFVNKQEEGFSESASDLQLIWGAKEAFFKKKGGRMNDLKNQVTITAIDRNESTIQLEYQQEIDTFDFLSINTFWLVYG